MNKNKVILFITEILIGSASTFIFSTMGFINPGAGNIISSGTALLITIAILIANLKKKYVIQSYEIGLMSLPCYMRKL